MRERKQKTLWLAGTTESPHVPQSWGASLWVIPIRISDPRSLGLWQVKWAHESTHELTRIYRFIWSTMIRMILDHWSWFGSSQRNAPVADPREGPGGPWPPLFLDQNEARKAKIIFLRPPPPPPLSEGLDPPLLTIGFRIPHRVLRIPGTGFPAVLVNVFPYLGEN